MYGAYDTIHIVSVVAFVAHTVLHSRVSRCVCAQPELGVLVDKKEQSLGEQLEGHDLTNSGFQIHFMQASKL